MHYTNKSNRGFTLVELLIVIVVIAILAAISIVAFNGVQQRGRDASRQSDVSNIVKALTAFTADDGTWPANAAEATADLNTYTTANLSTDITSRLSASAPAGTDTDTRNRYQYIPLCTGGNISGAQINWWNEQNGEVQDATAGSGAPGSPTTGCA